MDRGIVCVYRANTVEQTDADTNPGSAAIHRTMPSAAANIAYAAPETTLDRGVNSLAARRMPAGGSHVTTMKASRGRNPYTGLAVQISTSVIW
jgi:hypothetical protein